MTFCVLFHVTCSFAALDGVLAVRVAKGLNAGTAEEESEGIKRERDIVRLNMKEQRISSCNLQFHEFERHHRSKN